ncbi:MAG TPA: DUF2807 domain-containing protein, partial [Bacteroidales bacterium]|nr:DUF2807 domain-containing protein [Bacteroidales bacterium]
MKKIAPFLFFILSGLFILTSCIDILDNSVSGNGNVISEKREVDSFDVIEVSSGLNVYAKFGEAGDELEVVADENLQQYIITEVHGGRLKIRTERSIRHARSKDIYVNAGSLRSIGVSSAANLKGENRLVSGDLRIDVSSAGDLNLDLEAGRLDIEVSS